MAIQDDSTVLCKGDLKAYHESILPYLGGNFMLGTNVSDYYSEDEKIVGIWVDGKPVYQKTVDCGALPNATSKVIEHGIANIDILVNIFGVAIETTLKETRPIPSDNTTNVGYGISIDADRTGISIGSGIVNRSGYHGYVTLQYTKTTDAANSAVTTPGCYDINFPNTWPENTEVYFGNGLYGQRFTGTMATSTIIQELNLKTGLPTATALVKVGGILKRHVMGTSYYDFVVPCVYDNLINASVAVDVGTIKLIVKNSGAGNIPYDVWVCYTK